MYLPFRDVAISFHRYGFAGKQFIYSVGPSRWKYGIFKHVDSTPKGKEIGTITCPSWLGNAI